jgi:probable F420-dependent oxidoreductase
VGERRQRGGRRDGTVTLPIGIVPPILTAVPGMHNAWERDADVDALVRVVQCADRLGFDHVTCSEHIAVPTDVAGQRGGTYWDPLATLAFLAAGTTRIRLVTHVVVLGYHHPLALAKSYGTLDRLSRGRLTLGLGVGSLEEEFALLGASYGDRGARADDAIAALRAALGARTPTYRGDYYAFDDNVVDPTSMQSHLPFWVGGRTARSLRRAVEHGDGWAPFALGFRAVAELLETIPPRVGFDVVLGLGVIDPIGAPDAVTERLDRAAAAGATRVNAGLSSRSADHYCEQLGALAELSPASMAAA